MSTNEPRIELRPGTTFTSLAELARESCCSRRAVRRSLEKLVRRGYLVADEIPDVGVAYLLAFPHEEPEAVRADPGRDAIIVVEEGLADKLLPVLRG